MGEIVLNWEDHDKALVNKLLEFLEEEYLVDFNVTCHGQHMKVHKFVLAFLFPMLKESLRSSTTFCLEQETTRNVKLEAPMSPECLNLDNIANHPEDMDYLIQFAYTGKTIVPNEHVECLMRIADSMEIESLKESLGQWHYKINPEVKTEPNDDALLNILRPQTELQQIISERVEEISSNDDLDFNYIEDSNFDSMESSEDYSDDDYEEIINRSRKKNTKQNKVSQKRQSEGVDSRKKSLKTKTATETTQNETNTDYNIETPSMKRRITKSTSSEIRERQTRNLKCGQCNYVANFPSKLQRHLKTHEKAPKNFFCNTCNNDTGNQSSSGKNCPINCSTELFMCKYCGYMARRKLSLRHHIIAIHQLDAEGNPLEKNVKCPDCDYVCYAKHQLRTHISAKHKRINMFKCKKCDYAAPYECELARHERQKHENIRNFKCDECGHAFTTRGRLNDHVLVRHRGVKPYKCDICSAEYSDPSSFKLHMQRHEGVVEYKLVCQICGHRSRKKCDLKMHMYKKHDMELDETSTN